MRYRAFIASRGSVRGEFPGIAVFALLLLLLALAAVVAVSLKPWGEDVLAPDLRIEPGLEVALDDAVAVASPPPGRVAAADVAGPGGPTVAIAQVVAPEGAVAPQLGVSTAEVVLAAAPAPTPASPTPAPPQPAPAPVTTPTPVATPAPAAAPAAPPTFASGGSGSGGGIPAGVPGVEPDPEPTCEGDEYEVTVRFESETLMDEDEVEVLIRQIVSEGSESEIELEGTWANARELIEQLVSEESCVTVEFEPVGEEAVIP